MALLTFSLYCRESLSLVTFHSSTIFLFQKMYSIKKLMYLGKKYFIRAIVLVKSGTGDWTVISSSSSRPHEGLTDCKVTDSTFISKIFKTGCCSLSVGQHFTDKAHPVIVLYQIIHMNHINHSEMPGQRSDKKLCILLTVAVGV